MTVTTVACTINSSTIVIDDSRGVNYVQISMTKVTLLLGESLLEVPFIILKVFVFVQVTG